MGWKKVWTSLVVVICSVALVAASCGGGKETNVNVNCPGGPGGTGAPGGPGGGGAPGGEGQPGGPGGGGAPGGGGDGGGTQCNPTVAVGQKGLTGTGVMVPQKPSKYDAP